MQARSLEAGGRYMSPAFLSMYDTLDTSDLYNDHKFWSPTRPLKHSQ